MGIFAPCGAWLLLAVRLDTIRSGSTQATLPTTVYVAAGNALSVCALTNVWSISAVERSGVLVWGVSPVNVLPFTAPGRFPGGGVRQAHFGTSLLLVLSALKSL